MSTHDTGNYARPVTLFEAFLQKRQIVADQLREAGYSIDELPSAQSRPGAVVDTLREAGFDGEDEVLLESGSTSDFATYLADKVNKRLMHGYTEAPSAWRSYSRPYSVSDFKPQTFVRLTEMEELLEVPEGGPYTDSKIDEITGTPLTVGTFGRLFSLTRQALINDDLDQLRDRPAALGRAYVRSVNRTAVRALEGNANAYDGNATFSVAHKNLITDPLDEASLAKAAILMRKQSDPNGLRLALTPRNLVIPPDLWMVARRALQSVVVPRAGEMTPPSTPKPFNYGDLNVVAGLADPVVEDYLTDPSDWYLVADPSVAPVLAVGFLNGKQTPDVFLKDPGMRNVIGGSDPYSMEFDEITWKVRGDWGAALIDWRGIVKSAVAD